MKLKFRKLKIKKIPAPNFLMSPVELNEYIDFKVKRFYFITKPINEKKSGAHCHIKEKEFLILIQGSCTGVINYGEGLKEIEMEGPADAFYIGSKVWHQFKNFSDDAILLALSSTNYDPTRSGYVEDYEKYIKKILKQ